MALARSQYTPALPRRPRLFVLNPAHHLRRHRQPQRQPRPLRRHPPLRRHARQRAPHPRPRVGNLRHPQPRDQQPAALRVRSRRALLERRGTPSASPSPSPPPSPTPSSATPARQPAPNSEPFVTSRSASPPGPTPPIGLWEQEPRWEHSWRVLPLGLPESSGPWCGVGGGLAARTCAPPHPPSPVSSLSKSRFQGV